MLTACFSFVGEIPHIFRQIKELATMIGRSLFNIAFPLVKLLLLNRVRTLHVSTILFSYDPTFGEVGMSCIELLFVERYWLLLIAHKSF
jgi:hypothetical protein